VLAFEPLKASLLRGAAVIIAVSWLWARMGGRTPSVDTGAQPVVRAGLALIGLAGVSTALSLEPRLSFFGSFDRGDGWLSLAASGILLVTAADLFADAHRRERAINALVLGSIVPCGYLLLQRVGFDPMHWAASGTHGSSLGSPTFLGGYLVLVAPFALYRVVARARQASLRAYAGWLALLVVICSVVLLTTIRGPLLGLVAGVLTLVVFARAGSGRRIGKQDIAGAALLAAAAIALAVTGAGGRGVGTLQRFLTIGQGLDSSSQRLTVWQDALRAPFSVSDPARVAFGFGAESQSVVFEHAEATVRRTPVELWDRAHNLLLDTWLTGGLVGVAALVVVVSLAVRSALRAHAAGANRLLAAAIIAAIAGHLVEVAFAFHTVVTGALFWVVLGLAASLNLTPRSRRLALPWRPWLAGLIAVVGGLLLPVMAAPAVADSWYGVARRLSYVDGAQLEEQAAAWAPWVEELPRAAGLDWEQAASRRADPEFRARAEQDLREAAARAPLLPTPFVRLTRLYLARGDLAAGEQACQRAIANGPYRAAVWDACADVSAARGPSAEATARRTRADTLRQPS
jgi:O-antigen ligase